MSPLHLIRMTFDPAALAAFAAKQGLLDDSDLGYILHAWLRALFGDNAPKPFRQMPRSQDVLGYARGDAAVLLNHLHAFADPSAYAALVGTVQSKPMPASWQTGQRVHLEATACPVSRVDQTEKDIYLRNLDRSGDATPPRAEVYRHWFEKQCDGALALESLTVAGMQSRRPLVRRSRASGNRLVTVERPWVAFSGNAHIQDGARFADLLARGVGRHRAFGVGMILLAPPR